MHDAGSYYGPFVSSVSDDQYTIESLTNQVLGLQSDHIAVFKEGSLGDVILEIIISGAKNEVITSLKDVSKCQHEEMDYIPDRKLIKFFSSKRFGKKVSNLAKKEAEKLQQSIATFEKQSVSRKNLRLDRLKGMLDRYISDGNVGSDLIQDYIDSSSQGKALVKEYIESNRKLILDEKIADIEQEAKDRGKQVESHLKELDLQVDARNEELTKIRDEVGRARKKAQQEIKEIEDKTKEQIERDMAAQQQELYQTIEDKQQEVVDKKAEIDSLDYIIKYGRDIAKLEEEKTYLEKHNGRLLEATSGLERKLKNPAELAHAIGEMEAINLVMHGRSATTSNLMDVPFVPSIVSSEPSSAEEYVYMVMNHFDDDSGRKFSYEEMTNLLVSIHQSFMTVLSGRPGTGKTSTAIRLAQALHLGGTEGDKNFLYIPVGRGWVSGRDILGFYNPLKNQYQESRTGLYRFLNRTQPVDVDPYQLILLDESNLSSMEHYWSDFLGMCDPEGRDRPIDIGVPDMEKQHLKVNPNVRFIATINNDSTTERLSPRLIDRVPVINLEQDNIDIGEVVSSSQILDGVIGNREIDTLFNMEDAEISRASLNTLNSVINMLSKQDNNLGQGIAISRRKVIAISSYCAVAEGMLGQNVALDFAISQHILPHIEGYGKRFRSRLENLNSEILKNYPRSSHILDSIIAQGDDFSDTYSFF
ncbi:MAG TPA: AAA family ATPase [Gammaproteobacteria bacterium]|nr:AAA family ATPase [Gammaproteobacteria bacterium]